MCTRPRSYWGFVIAAVFVFATAPAVFGAGSPAQTLNVPVGGIVEDETEPDVTARVARISFLNGDAKIRHADSDEWETVTLNLPVVEGDEIVTDAGARLEIQFDNYKHLRLAENAYLKIANLKPEGIAVSISLGTMTLRITAFDKDKSYFEIDAPKTTIAIQRSGTYRVDAGKEGDTELRASITNGGEARIYSDNAGFTLKNGRTARIFIDGPTAGEWETAEASRYADDLDQWALDRDETIARRLKDAYYDKYYDQDIYGADDLNDHGDWVYRGSYGYVWRPHRASLARYADWSPYRYGHWRWIQPYGWVWVNDEPWGWATYHHGRWFHDAGYWYWSPYGHYRPARSWWFPALVVINVINTNVCWYPLPYQYSYYNYNWYNQCGRGRRCHGNNNNPPPGGVNPTPPVITPIATSPRIRTPGQGPLVPTSGVVSLPTDDFGVRFKGVRTAPLALATTMLTKPLDQVTVPRLPNASAIKTTRDMAATKPRIDTAPLQANVGAAPRKTAAPLDNELRTTKVFGGRPPVTEPVNLSPVREPVNTGSTPEPRKTGAVERPIVTKQPVENAPIRQTPTKVRETPPQDAPIRQAPPVKETPRYDPPPVKQETPRYDPPVRQTPPPKSDPPPTRSEPTKQAPPPTKSDPPPSKSEPAKPDPGTRKKDGR